MNVNKWDIISAVVGAIVLLVCLAAMLLITAGCEFKDEDNVTYEIHNADGKMVVIQGTNNIQDVEFGQ